MEIVAVQKFIRMSPKKLRIVADKVRKMKPQAAVDILPFVEKSAAEPLMKVIKTAIANARVKNVSEDLLRIKEVQINEGPRLKRGRPVSRGRSHPYKRRMSHIRVVLTTKSVPKAKKVKGDKEKNGTEN
ncbi:50S ribosomal protein L22 [Candidatus Woesebacteria bacterium RIFCSPHIGHO2_02_FULL_42_20]|uniref:Large ribosomal subunit protein uL22 n=1 Tax=Candidatus Woesebacteria bacterium RIFCSPHIGHO2_12_FULL_41_24 TaxID=1802510 RepID=A0A1F8APJ0_9BACT|nr:MAG: 50S ribosomal protein L22 [Candidatus Woesebacteria bacterium RBG_16_41_13]OGM29240.1 MAG: 50S ribosomal protein L22 [Candidatus Woesebacteria bacterium RIFCSPHIGHO2_01_FULL_42_80]OGM34738.1 MAG: 50S ribosomal protein L22 [Candidatus Woesebacteria bacterium RIFCSPHIGHO2_02_FULL_42_20]OGM53673.1 MAG: 50S ribosomal protein L22 [Candidatus Woesebacteria bacterium RIFCSPHIGHO2_12_FULL_41_24]OGM67037.1 MAG: 50S ribosomal protein L22 [Candidatus Woesebacteria bacterium RIFCSPLOWO2_01_FULL_42_